MTRPYTGKDSTVVSQIKNKSLLAALKVLL